MVAYGGGKSWGEILTFKPRDNGNQNLVCKYAPAYPKYTVGKGDDAKDYAQSEITFYCPGQDCLYIDHDKRGAAYWLIYKNNDFTIESVNGRPIRHISVSFSSLGDHGGERVRVNSGGTWKWFDWKYVDLNGSHYGDGCWYPDEGKEYTKVTLSPNQKHEVDILWIKVFFDDTSTSNKSLSFSGSTTFTQNTTDVKLTQNGYSTVYWTSDNSDPKTSSKRTTGTFDALSSPITESKIFRAVGEYTTTATAMDSEVNEDDSYEFKQFGATATYQVNQICDVGTSNGRHTDGKYYATFYHNHNMIVPDNCSAWTYKKITKNGLPYMAPSKEYSTTAVKVIPAYTAVIVCSNSAQSKLTFTNPVNNSSTGAEADNNKCSDFTGNSEYDAQDVSASGYTNYYLMTDGDNGGLKFMRYNGKCPSHACYLHLSSSSPLAKGFVFSFPDETTGINVISADNSVSGDNAPMYNAAGQRVGSGYKGIVIQNGRKFIRR